MMFDINLEDSPCVKLFDQNASEFDFCLDRVGNNPIMYGLRYIGMGRISDNPQKLDQFINKVFGLREQMDDYDDILFLDENSDVHHFCRWFINSNDTLRKRLNNKGILTELILKGLVDD